MSFSFRFRLAIVSSFFDEIFEVIFVFFLLVFRPRKCFFEMDAYLKIEIYEIFFVVRRRRSRLPIAFARLLSRTFFNLSIVFKSQLQFLA